MTKKSKQKRKIKYPKRSKTISRKRARAIVKKTPRRKSNKKPGVRKVRPRLRQPKRVAKQKQTESIKEVKHEDKKVVEMKKSISESADILNKIDKKIKKEKTSNVFNVGQYIRKNTELKVSPAFVDEIIGRIKDLLDMDVYEATRIAKAMGMKTLMEIHAIRIYDYKRPDGHHIVTCGDCGGSFAIANSSVDKEKKLICPFCGSKRHVSNE